MPFYFTRYEGRKPPPPVPHSDQRESLWQFLATVSLVLGGWYIGWRWLYSLNYDALWFALPVALAETLAYFGLILFTVNLWKTSDPPILPPPENAQDCDIDADEPGRPIAVDVFFATYNEDPELVRLGLRDARNIRYPHPLDLRIHVLDDGKRPAMAAVAAEEGVNYITRPSNIGFKAGNLRNAIEHTSGDFILICDADTRPFATILERTLGYFRDPKMAWVQTPQWFYDLPAGKPLPKVLERRFGRFGRFIGRAVERVIGPVEVGHDPFVNDPQLFYDIILRRRNWANAGFCCGAASIHRREAVMEAALRSYVLASDRDAEGTISSTLRMLNETTLDPVVEELIRQEAALNTEVTPYKFHASEDIFTSIVLHSDRERGWKSVQHPFVESKMLSPQDLLTWAMQRFRYAGGSLDILFHENPLFRKGLTLPQKIMYGSTFYSYLGAIWNTVFLLAPIIYLLFNVAPVAAYSDEFFMHLIPFLIANELATMVGTWNIAGYKPKAAYLNFFPINLRAIWTTLLRKEIKFKVTPKVRQEGNFLYLVWPQLAIILLTLWSLAFAFICWSLDLRDYKLGALLANLFWGLNNVLAMLPIVTAAFYQEEPLEDEPEPAAIGLMSGVPSP
ncbi:glycosyltransferase [Geminicoccus roseus]|uniref:glycosyltransferase n=1 Tax=Geminicoccus roseus TaxID=404900 RepID=UPI000423D3C8|nr:glycosyltransferase [Geminicoccus roseus]